MLIKLKEAINLFERCFGQGTNRNSKCGDEELLQMVGKLGCKVEKLPVLSLGLPLGGYPTQKDF